MKVKGFNQFLNEKANSKKLKYYSFDVDDNLLFMDTTIIMEHLVDDEWVDEEVSTEVFAKVRNDKVNWRFKPGQESFINFRDYGPKKDDTFISDFKKAVINKRFAPSWTTFIECLINGNIFSIITSRGHSPKNIRRAIYWLIYEYGLDRFKNLPLGRVNKGMPFEDQMIINLLKFNELFGYEPGQIVDSYIETCPIYTITSAYFIEKFGEMPAEEAKKVALIDFNDIVHNYANMLGTTAEYGFSDDDPKFVKAAIDQFVDLKQSTKNIKYSVFDTGNKQIKKIEDL